MDATTADNRLNVYFLMQANGTLHVGGPVDGFTHKVPKGSATDINISDPIRTASGNGPAMQPVIAEEYNR